MSEHEPKYHPGIAAAWIGVVLALSMVPLGIGILGPPPAGREFWIEFGVALGFLGMGLMCVQFLFSGRFAWVAARFGTDYVLQFHRQLGIVGFLLILGHPVALILAEPEFARYFDPRENFLRAAALSYAVIALAALIATTFWREAMHIPYEWWRAAHGLLALSIVFVGVVHGIQVGHYLDPDWKKALWAAYAALAMYLVVHTRLVRPLRSRKRPYRITAVEPERGDVTVLTLEPDGHEGIRHRAGQYAWITVGATPFKLQQHPFSFVSDGSDGRVQFAARGLGDFTCRWKEFTPGLRVFLEGPFGAFTRNPHPDTGQFLIVGGIGITPAISLLRESRREPARHPTVLLYANSTWDEVAFRDEIADLERQLPLTVVHVLSDPPDGWEGESGLVDEAMIARHLPPNRHEYEYYLCGPKPMMDAAERALRSQGVSWRRVYAERFQIV